MREGTGSGAEGNLHACRDGFGETAFREFRNTVAMVFLLVLLTIELIVIQSGHQINAFLDHHLDLAIVKIPAMVDRFHASVYAVMQTLATKSVTRNLVSSPVSLVYDCIYFFCRERGWDNQFSVFGEMKLVCRIQLDPICAMRDLLPHRLTSGPGRVHDLQRDRKR